MERPEPLKLAVRTAHVSPSLRALLAHLPGELRLDLVASTRGPWPPSVPTLIKASDSIASLRLETRFESRAACRLVARRFDRQVSVDLDDIGPSFEQVVDRLLLELLEPNELGHLLREVALVGATTSTLQLITTHMLSSYSLPHALTIMLAGITAGYCLGFNRAALFRYDAERERLVGEAAIGPDSDEEAHRIWEGVEAESQGILDLIARLDPTQPMSSRFYERVRTIAIPLDEADEEIGRALTIATPTRFRQATIRNPRLAALGTNGEFVLAPIRAHQRLLGMLFADDYFQPAPIDGVRLQQLGFFIDQTALVWENFELLARERDFARRDPLTGTLNRREFDRLAAELEGQSDIQLALIVIDVDLFKSVNDRRGHAEGDRILRAVARALGTGLREDDLLCRWGGDEFVILLPDADAAVAELVAERLVTLARERLPVTLSLGAAASPIDGEDVATLFQQADERLYRAKAAGRNRAVVSATEA